MKWRTALLAGILQVQFPGAAGYVTVGQFLGFFETIFLINAAYLEALLPGLKVVHGKSPDGEAQSFGLLDPKLCYLLDGILFIYGVIVTALYLRAKFSQSVDAAAYLQGPNQLYNELNLGRREEYDVLDKKRARDPEMGGKQQRRRNPQEGLYNALQKDKMAEAYSEIGMKGERRRGKGHDGLYQGLSAATKDTYDALHMQTLPLANSQDISHSQASP